MTDFLTQLIGTLIIAVALVDIYLTVLQGGSISLFSDKLNRGVWWVFQKLVLLFPRQRNRILPYAGPTLIPVTVILWAALLAIGFALIFLPVMGTRIVASSGETPVGFWPALCFSLMSLVTLGAGDFVATSNLYRLLDTFGAFAGFAVLTAAISYLMSVYSASTRQNTFALSLHHATGDEGGSVELLTKLGAGGDFSVSQSAIGTMATDLIALIESHHTYTVLRYFRSTGTPYALPRIAFLVLDTASLIRSALDQQHYHAFVHSTSVAQLWGAGMQMMTDLGPSFLPSGLIAQHATTDADERQWRTHFDELLAQLRDEGIVTTTSSVAEADRYVALRRQWQPYVSAFSDYLMYDWNEIHPDSHDLRFHDARQ